MSNNLAYTSLYPHRNPTSGREYLDQKFFLLVMTGTLLLHMACLYIWHLLPKTEVLDIPVRVLNIKLGDMDDASDTPTAPAAESVPAVPDVVEPMMLKMPLAPEAETVPHPKTETKSSATKALDKAMSSSSDAASQQEAQKLATIAKQFVRANGQQTAAGKTPGSALGNNSAKEAELMSRYEQLISLWIEKFKLYPDEAREQGLHGETVVRIRIDRQGNIRYYVLERSTGFQILDRATIDMVRRANPVPAVPSDYPRGDLIEFLIPVNFHLQ